MSYVTEVLLYGLGINEPVAKINTWLRDNKVNGELLPINGESAGGGRPFAMDVFAMAVNYMPVEAFQRLLYTIDFGMFDDQVVVLMTTETNPTLIFKPTK